MKCACIASLCVCFLLGAHSLEAVHSGSSLHKSLRSSNEGDNRTGTVLKLGEEGFSLKVTKGTEGCILPTRGDRLTMHYTGMLSKGGFKFDSSRDRNEPFTFTLGRTKLIR